MIDELGYLTYGSYAANHLFPLVDQRYLQKRPILITSNKDPSDWGKVLHDPDLAEAIPETARSLARSDEPSERPLLSSRPREQDQASQSATSILSGLVLAAPNAALLRPPGEAYWLFDLLREAREEGGLAPLHPLLHPSSP